MKLLVIVKREWFVFIYTNAEYKILEMLSDSESYVMNHLLSRVINSYVLVGFQKYIRLKSLKWLYYLVKMSKLKYLCNLDEEKSESIWKEEQGCDQNAKEITYSCCVRVHLEPIAY